MTTSASDNSISGLNRTHLGAETLSEHQTTGIGQMNLEDLEKPEETRCGLGSWQPEWLQKFASKKTFVLVYGLIGMIDTSIQAYNGATISTIEKRFKIPSRTSGIIASAWDTGVLSTVMVLAYLGTSRHRTRWVAAGTFVIGLANFMRILPHLIYGPGMDALKLTKEYEELYEKAQHIANIVCKIIRSAVRKFL